MNVFIPPWDVRKASWELSSIIHVLGENKSD